MTQVLVETVSLLLLLLAFRRLPALKGDERTVVQKVMHGSIAALMGGLVILAVLSAAVSDPETRSGMLHLQLALPEAAGRNVVNVILTDFRAADTLVEIAVLAVAALGVLALVKPRRIR
jgi:multisubunit Na+/H+ antiporter MnhB subunit